MINRPAWLPHQRRLYRLAVDRLPVLEARFGQGPAEETQTAPAERQSSGSLPGEAVQELQGESSTDVQETNETSAEEQQIALFEDLRSRQQPPGLRLAFLIASWLTIVPYTGWNTVQNSRHHAWLPMGIWVALFVAALTLNRLVVTGRHRDLARKLADYKHVQFIGTFVEMFQWPDREIQRVARDTLTELLPKLRASDAGLLNAAHWRCLYRRLNMEEAKYHSSFLKAILKALEQVGGETALPYVERLAEGTAITGAQKSVRQAATDCLPALYSRSEQTHASQTLLRAAGMGEDRAAMLLRPTTEAVITDPEQLIRATALEEGSI